MAFTSAYPTDNPKTTAIDGLFMRASDLTLLQYPLKPLPTKATVNGIVLTWTGGTAAYDETDTVMMVNNGNGFSQPLAANSQTTLAGENPQPNTGTVTYGGATNLWGLTWTPFQVGSISTRFLISNEFPAATGYHDAFQITVYYTVPGGFVRLKTGKLKLRGKISL